MVVIRSAQEQVLDALTHGPNSVHGIVEATGLRSGEVLRAALELIADSEVRTYRGPRGRLLLAVIE